MTSESPTPEQLELLAELPFLVMAVAFARSTELTEDQIAAAQSGLNELDLAELRAAVAATGHSPTERFEMAWLEDDPSAAVGARVELLAPVYGEARAAEIRQQLLELGRACAARSDAPELAVPRVAALFS